MNNSVSKTKFVVFDDYDFYIKNRKVDKGEFYELTKEGNEDREKNIMAAKIIRHSINEIGFLYDPLTEAEGLFTELIKIPSIFDENYNVESLLTFIKRFGLPIGESFWNERYEIVPNAAMNFFKFNQLLDQYKDIFNIIYAIKSNDLNQIKLYKEQYESTYKTHFKGDLKPDTDIEKAFYMFSNKLEKQKKENYTYIYSNNKPQKVYTFEHLFQVAYFQLCSFLDIDGEFKKCEHCGGVFPITHESRKFCLPIPGKTESTCLNTYKQRVKRDKNKAIQLFEQGKTIDKITDIINKKRDEHSKRTKQEIEAWIK